MPEVSPPRRPGRPSRYSFAGALQVAQLIAAGHSLRSIVEHQPRSRAQLARWVRENPEAGVLLAVGRVCGVAEGALFALDLHRAGTRPLDAGRLSWFEALEPALDEVRETWEPILYPRTAEEREESRAWCAEATAEDILALESVGHCFEGLLGRAGPMPAEEAEVLLANLRRAEALRS